MARRANKMRRILVPQQPTYMAWPGYYARMIGADHLILMDDVQFVDRGWQNRNHIWDPSIQRRLLTIPVTKNGRFGQKIRDVEISGIDWSEKHFNLIKHSYPKLHRRGHIGETLQSYYSKKYKWLTDANEEFISMAIRALGIDIKVSASSTLGINGEKTHRLVNMCKATDCNVMRVGPGALDYLDLELLAASEIDLEVVRTVPRNTDQESELDLSRLSVIDTMIRHGDESRSELECNYWMEQISFSSPRPADRYSEHRTAQSNARLEQHPSIR